MSWPLVALGEITEIVSGSTPKSSEKAYWDGEVLWATPKDLSLLNGDYISRPARNISEAGLNSCSAKLLPPGSVLLSSRAPIGLAAINTEPMATNQGFKSLVPNTEHVHNKYLLHWIRSHTDRLQSLGNGATFKELPKSTVSRIQIPLPPLEEQRRIAAILDKADALRRKRREALALLDTLTQSIFVEMFGDDAGTSKKLLVDIVQKDDKICYGVVQPGDDPEDGIPLIRGTDLRFGRVDRKGLRRVSKATSEKHRKSLLKGDEILISCVGRIGEIALAEKEDRGSNIARQVVRVPVDQSVNRVFLAEYLKLPATQNYFVRELRTVAQPTLNVKQIKEAPILLPDISRQNAFEEATREIGSCQSDLQGSANALSYLFASLQSRAFNGTL